MARYIYQWKPTEHGKRLFAIPSTTVAPRAPKRPAEPEPPAAPAYGSLKKDELVALAEQRGVDASGTKADIIGRLEAGDE